MAHMQFLNSRHDKTLLYHPKPRHQTMMMPSTPIYDDIHSMLNNRMYIDPGSAMPLPPLPMPPPPHPPFLKDFSGSYPVGPGAAYGILGSPSSLPSRHSYMPMGVNFGCNFPCGPPPPNVYLPPREINDTAVLRAQFYMNALQNQVNSLLHASQMPNPQSVAESVTTSPPDKHDDIFAQDSTVTEVPWDNLNLPALPKLHAGGSRLAEFVPAQSAQQDTLSGWLNSKNPPPLHLPAVKNSSVIRQHKMSDCGTKRKLPEDLDTNLLPNDCIMIDGDKDAPSRTLSRVDCTINMTELPPLQIGNRDLAKKLTEATGKNANVSSTSGKRDVTERDHVSRHRRNSAYSRIPNLVNTSDFWLQQDALSKLGSRQSVISRHPSMPCTYGELSDVDVMRHAYKTESRISSGSRMNGNDKSSKHTPPLDPNDFRLSGKRHLPPHGIHPLLQSPLSYPPSLQKHLRELQSERNGHITSKISDASGRPNSGLNLDRRSASDIVKSAGIAPADVAGTEPSNCESGLVNVKQELVENEQDSYTVLNSSTNKSLARVERNDVTMETAVSMATPDRNMSVTNESKNNDMRLCKEDFQKNIIDRNPVEVPLNLTEDPSTFSYDYLLRHPPLGTQLQQIAPPGDMCDDRTGEFRCNLCNYSGRSQHCLDKHFRAHSQACKICRYCLKAFERPSDLVRHEERHQKRNHALLKTKNCTTEQGKPVTSKKRRSWFCQQCNFSCTEAKMLIQHTRKVHPILHDCTLCHMKFISEVELAEHKSVYHPVAVGRIDTYHAGVLTGTRLVSCGITGEQEVSVDVKDLTELPLDCSGIPEVSNLQEAQFILGQKRSSDCDLVRNSVLMSEVINASSVEPESFNLLPSDEYAMTLSKYPVCEEKNACDMEETIVAVSSLSGTDPTCTASLTLDSEALVISHAFGADEDIRKSKSPVVSASMSSPTEVMSEIVAEPLMLELDCNCMELKTKNGAMSTSESTEVEDRNNVIILNSHEMKSNLGSVNEKDAVSNERNCDAESINMESEIEKVSKTLKTELVGNEGADENEIVLENTNKGIVEDIFVDQSVSAAVSVTSEKLLLEINPAKKRNSAKVIGEHKNAEKKNNAFVCIRCNYSTNAKFKYQQHLRAHNGRFICKCCSKACIKSSDLYRHWVTHNVKGPDGFFACDSCDFTSPQKYAIEDHMKQHYIMHPEHRPRQQSVMSRCGLCQKNVLRTRLFEHKRIVHGKFFMKDQNHAAHGKVETDANGNSIKGPPKIYSCPQCDRKFTTPSYLLRHHFVHHEPNSQTKSDDSACCCRFCGTKFDDVDHLYEHEVSHIVQNYSHTNGIQQPQKLKTKSIDAKPSLPVKSDASSKSPKTSPNRRKLSCPHCKKPFKLQYFLDQHMRVHSDERPFVCQWCGSGFAIFQYLNIHRRFKCPNRKISQSMDKTTVRLSNCETKEFTKLGSTSIEEPHTCETDNDITIGVLDMPCLLEQTVE